MRGWRSLGNDASLHNKGSLFTLMLGPPGMCGHFNLPWKTEMRPILGKCGFKIGQAG